jgi:hypothetical protein
MIFLLVILYAVLILIDVPPLIREKSRRELIVYCVLISLAFAIALLLILHVKMPNPVKSTQYVVKDFFKLLHLTYD